MSTATLYKEDFTKKRWESILYDLGLPADTDEICIKHINHITQSMRTKNKEKQNAEVDNNRT